MRVESPLELLFVTHYKDVFAQSRWDRARVRRLCDLLQISERELARFIRVIPSNFSKCGELNKYPQTIELHLETIERCYNKTIYGIDAAKPLFPAIT